SWNPGLRRKSDYLAVGPYSQYLNGKAILDEVALSGIYRKLGYRAVILDKNGFVRHLGWDRHAGPSAPAQIATVRPLATPAFVIDEVALPVALYAGEIAHLARLPKLDRTEQFSQIARHRLTIVEESRLMVIGSRRDEADRNDPSTTEEVLDSLGFFRIVVEQYSDMHVISQIAAARDVVFMGALAHVAFCAPDARVLLLAQHESEVPALIDQLAPLDLRYGIVVQSEKVDRAALGETIQKFFT
ncbi:MAG TPA: hypothetical protein PLY97_11795, partial [Acidocella sp.]